MNLKKIFLIFGGLTLVILLAISVTYFSLGHISHHKKAGHHGIDSAHDMLHKMDLSDGQRKQLEPLEVELKKKLDEIQIKMAKDQIATCSLMNTSESNWEDVEKSVEKIGEYQIQQKKLVTRHFMMMREILTPDQRNKLFTSMMSDICQKCRSNVGLSHENCMCGQCPIHRTKEEKEMD